MLRHNYHTHTYRCGHADGSDEDYVVEAIAQGIVELGFSDHIMLPNFSQKSIRGDYELEEGYLNSLNSLKKKYENRIKIRIGYEAEAFEKYYPHYRELLESKKVEYLILGNHCYLNENNQVKFFFSHITSKQDVIDYGRYCVKGMKTGLFKYVAHPDYFMGSYLKWDSVCEKVAKNICKTAQKMNMPLEFNFGALRRGKRQIGEEYRYAYPYKRFWDIAKKYKVKVVLGLDAHSPRDISTDKNDAGYRLIKEWDLNVIDEVEI